MLRLATLAAVAGCATTPGLSQDAAVADGAPVVDATPPVDAPVRPPCVEGDDRVEDPVTGHCYMLLSQSRDWDSAVLECESVGDDVHLATIDGDAENAVVNNLAGQEVWIGGNDSDLEMTFVWVTGESFGYSNWREGEPNDTDGEDCIVYQGQLDGVWDDRPCGMGYPIVCERD